MVKTETSYGDRWDCPDQDCTVACWDGDTSTPADAETREARKETHELFDPLWQKGEFESREDAYEWLADRMDIPVDKCHIGMFDFDQCHYAMQFIIKRRMSMSI